MKASEAWRIVNMIYTSAGCVKFNEKIEQHLMEAETKSEEYDDSEKNLEKISSNFSLFARIITIIITAMFVVVAAFAFTGHKEIASTLASIILLICGSSAIAACVTLVKGVKAVRRKEKKVELLQNTIDWREASIVCMSRAIFLEKLEKMGLQFTPEEEKAVSGVLAHG